MSKKLIMYVYGNIITDARVQRAANALCTQYDVTLISTDCHKQLPMFAFENILVGGKYSNGMFDYLDTIFETVKIVKKQKPDILYCHDYYSSLLAKICKTLGIVKKVVYDAHELIIPENKIKNKRLSFFYRIEKSIIKKVDMVICASEERKKIMTEHYNLIKAPLVIRNISQLHIEKDEKTAAILRSLDGFFSNPGLTVVYAGVVTKSRKILDLVKAVSKVAANYKLLIVGDGDVLSECKEIASNNKSLTFASTGTIPYKSLGAILSKCDIGFVYYPIDTQNNTYCASNKIFEYASVKLPMISNENPTVKKDLEDNEIGVASNDLTLALAEIASKIGIFKANCERYTKSHPWTNEAQKLIDNINAI